MAVQNRLAQHTERNGDLSPSVTRPARISRVTRERWAQIGITVQFLIVVRTLGEFFRLRHVLGTSFSATVAGPYVDGALIAACFCWAGVTLYFFRRYTLSALTALASIVILLVYKIAVIGW
jgi:fucose 4-O-acetylase-like acetyltransferase